MIETQIGLLNETVSNMAKRFEEEKKQLEGACSGKDAELVNLKQEMEHKSGQLQSAEDQIMSLEQQLRLLREQNAQMEAEVGGLKWSLEEIKRVQSEEIENRVRERQDELAKEKELIEITIKGMDQRMEDERMKWREALRSN